MLAAKCALGVRVDALGDADDNGAIGLESRAKVGIFILVYYYSKREAKPFVGRTGCLDKWAQPVLTRATKAALASGCDNSGDGKKK